MASSNTSSPVSPARGQAPWPERERHALTGPSSRLDPARHPVRPDLADVALADRVFAPHYARALDAVAEVDAPIRAGADEAAEAVARLERGAAFRVLEIGRAFAWGQAGSNGAVGYVDRRALRVAPEAD